MSEQRLIERIERPLELVQVAESEAGDGVRRVRAIGLTADVVNENRRRYPLALVREA